MTCKDKKLLTIHQIQDTQTIILLFPTGLIIHFTANSEMTIQSKIQLNLKNDESIIDQKYCASTDNLHHCFWLIDQKYQVWKCYSDRNPNECNWTLIKVSILDNLVLNSFLEPAMTYEDFYMTQCLKDIQSFKQLTKADKQKEYLIAFNGTATKLMLVKQAQTDYKIETFDNLLDNVLLSKMPSLKNQILKRNNTAKPPKHDCIQLFSICKQHNVIINQVPEKKQTFLFEDGIFKKQASPQQLSTPENQ